MLLDANCQGVQRAPHTSICGDLQVSYAPTPISFNWGDAIADEEEALVNFPLNDELGGKWYTWKASASKPLLVLDPEQSGQITTARQLFGSWTFGGKNTKSANMSSSVTAKPVAWTCLLYTSPSPRDS